jgi:hypothetical protein
MGIAALLVGSILYVMEDTPKGQMEIVKIRKLLGRPIKSADLLSLLPRLFRKS